MKIKCLTSLKFTLGFIGLFHFTVGLFTLIPFIPKNQVAAFVYKATIEASPQLMHVGEMVGCYMFTIGFMTLLALRDPLNNIIIIKGLIVLLTLRLISIILFSSQEYAVFGIPPFRYWLNAGVIFILLVSLIYLKPKPE